ncbi:MAG: hypothetical protein M1333_03145 [Patescibacteria group bacterium]|nr:hypothetical protein [Patescibacteria group bacterium]
MAFGPVIDVPLMSAAFVLVIKWKDRVVDFVAKTRLPRILSALLVSVPLLIFEEHINCGAYWCTKVWVPPTLWFLLILELVFFGIVRLVKIKAVVWQTVLCSFLGMLLEFFLGSARAGLHQLAKEHMLVFLLLMVWVGFSYTFAYYLPLLIFNGPQKAGD